MGLARTQGDEICWFEFQLEYLMDFEPAVILAVLFQGECRIEGASRIVNTVAGKMDGISPGLNLHIMQTSLYKLAEVFPKPVEGGRP